VQNESWVGQANGEDSDVIKTGRRQPGVLIVTVLAAALGAAAATAASGQTAAPSLCTTSPVSSATPVTSVTSPFTSLGDSTDYVLASSGTPLLADGATLTSSCTRTPGITSTIRFYARSASGTGAIHVEVLVNRGTVVLDGGLVTAPATLTALTAVVIPWDRNGKGATDLQVRLTAVGGSFEIGNVYVDPFLMR
jgi:hypothetical protein